MEKPAAEEAPSNLYIVGRYLLSPLVMDLLSGYDTGTPSGWIATNALMAASDPRFADEFWEAVDGRGRLEPL